LTKKAWRHLYQRQQRFPDPLFRINPSESMFPLSFITKKPGCLCNPGLT
jgi:hypothetical protein